MVKLATINVSMLRNLVRMSNRGANWNKKGLHHVLRTLDIHFELFYRWPVLTNVWCLVSYVLGLCILLGSSKLDPDVSTNTSHCKNYMGPLKAKASRFLNQPLCYSDINLSKAENGPSFSVVQSCFYMSPIRSLL